MKTLLGSSRPAALLLLLCARLAACGGDAVESMAAPLTTAVAEEARTAQSVAAQAHARAAFETPIAAHEPPPAPVDRAPITPVESIGASALD